MRLIDADALLDRIPNLYERREVSRWVDDAPTVDAVPVVRCRDCKHHDGIRCFRWNSTIITGFDDFCSNGEQKDGDQ